MIFTVCAEAQNHNNHFQLWGFFSHGNFIWGFLMGISYRAGLGWAGMGWAELGWPGMGWPVLARADLGWPGLSKYS